MCQNNEAALKIIRLVVLLQIKLRKQKNHQDIALLFIATCENPKVSIKQCFATDLSIVYLLRLLLQGCAC